MKAFNNVSMMGKLYSYKLDIKDGDKGTYISGDVTLEVDDKGTKVKESFFASPVYKSGKPNRTYTLLEEMIAGNYNTVVDNGDDADWFEFSGGTIDVGYFPSQREPGEVARSQKCRGAFVNANRNHKFGNKWKCDMLITNVRDVEADDEKHLPRYVEVNGYIIDDYRETLKEVKFRAIKEAAMNYIVGLNCSAKEPYYVSIWGSIQTVINTAVTKNAFGEDEIREFENTQWVIDGMAPEAYDFADELGFEQYQVYGNALTKLKEEALKKDEKNAVDEDLPF